MVNDSGQWLPGLPAELPKDARHETANLVHSAAVRLLRAARAADAELDLDGPRASLLSVLVFAGPQPVTKLAEVEQVSAPAITKMVTAMESAGLAQRERSETDRRGAGLGYARRKAPARAGPGGSGTSDRRLACRRQRGRVADLTRGLGCYCGPAQAGQLMIAPFAASFSAKVCTVF
jgi:hypothetical protein